MKCTRENIWYAEAYAYGAIVTNHEQLLAKIPPFVQAVGNFTGSARELEDCVAKYKPVANDFSSKSLDAKPAIEWLHDHGVKYDIKDDGDGDGFGPVCYCGCGHPDDLTNIHLTMIEPEPRDEVRAVISEAIKLAFAMNDSGGDQYDLDGLDLYVKVYQATHPDNKLSAEALHVLKQLFPDNIVSDAPCPPCA